MQTNYAVSTAKTQGVPDTARARDALYSISPDLPRDQWVKAGMAAQSAGLDFDAFNDWSAQAGNYDERDASALGVHSSRERVLELVRCSRWPVSADGPREIRRITRPDPHAMLKLRPIQSTARIPGLSGVDAPQPQTPIPI